MITRYACPPVDAVWTEEAKLARWLTVWRASSAATGHPIPSRIEEISENLSRMREQVTGHDVQAALDVLRGQIEAVGARGVVEWLHFGLCSSDVVDAGWLLGIRDATRELSRMGNGLVQTLFAVGDQGTDALYRTHGRAAQVKPAGNRWAGHAVTLQQAQHAMRAARPDKIGFDGPTGNGGALTSGERQAIAETLRLRRRGEGQGQQAADRTEWAGWLSRVAALGTVCERIATEVRILSIEEVGEATEGRTAGYVGSSSMPHKSRPGVSNPTQSERICGLAPLARGLANGYTEAASSVWGAHSLEHSSAERVAIPAVTSLVGFVLTETATVVSQMVVNTDRVGENWERAVETASVTSYEDRARQLR